MPAERGDVLLHPPQRGDLVKQPPVGRGAVNRGEGFHPEPVVQGDELDRTRGWTLATLLTVLHDLCPAQFRDFGS